MSEAKISIVIPAYNEEGSIAQTIKDIIKNVKTPIEIVVVNDCSSDDTVKIVTEMDIENLNLYHNQKNEGFVKALQNGFDKANDGQI